MSTWMIVFAELLHESGHFGLFGVCIRSLQKNIFTDGCAVGQIGKFVLPGIVIVFTSKLLFRLVVQARCPEICFVSLAGSVLQRNFAL